MQFQNDVIIKWLIHMHVSNTGKSTFCAFKGNSLIIFIDDLKVMG